MPNIPTGMRECPTRADGTEALFAHVVRRSACQDRQRGFYHKCPTCLHYNARNGSAPNGAARNGAHGTNGVARETAPRLGERLEARRDAADS